MRGWIRKKSGEGRDLRNRRGERRENKPASIAAETESPPPITLITPFSFVNLTKGKNNKKK
jgi:hypothetical protein